MEGMPELTRLEKIFKVKFRTRGIHLKVASMKVFGRAIAEAVSRWLPTAAAWVRTRVWSSGICGGQNGVGAGFLRVLRFPLPFHQILHPHNHPEQVQ
jgi:hypothetical protein